MVQIGNWGFASHSTQDYIRKFQTNPKLTHDVIVHKDGINDIRPGITIIYQNINIDRPNMTDLAWIKSRFDDAVSYKDAYHYGAFLLYEELMSPVYITTM